MITTASILADFWNDQLVAHDRQALFLVLVAFLGLVRFHPPERAFGTQSARPVVAGERRDRRRGAPPSPGLGDLPDACGRARGFALFDSSPGLEICACLFGIGAGLTIDEFALWVYLDDVYWAKAGRSSIDAAVIAAGVMLLVLLGGRPFEVAAGSTAEVVAGTIIGLMLLALPAICFFKQRVLHGAVGLFLFPIAVYAAMRIAKPGSPWAKRFYGERNPGKQAKAEERFRSGRSTERFKERFRDAVGGETNGGIRGEARRANRDTGRRLEDPQPGRAGGGKGGR